MTQLDLLTGGVRAVPGADPLERYYTPRWATEAAVRHFGITGAVLEPCAGDGAISDVLRECGCRVLAGDVDPEASGAERTWDFVRWDEPLKRWARGDAPPGSIEWVVTNPPYSISHKVAEVAIDVAPRVALFLRLGWLEPAAKRRRLLEEHPPTHLLVTPRPRFTGPGAKKGTTPYAHGWIVWAPDLTDVPAVSVLTVRE